MEISVAELVETVIGARPKIESSILGATDPWVIGKHYLIRTVTMIQVGKLVWVGDKELVLANATWIADTGRFSDCLKNADAISEAEPFVNDVIIGRGAIVDATEWIETRVSRK